MDDVLGQMERHRQVALLQWALSQVPEKKRDVFVLYEIEELSMAEVAGVVGCPLPTAYTRLYAARRQIKRAIKRAQRARRYP
jgi:RNA polymerase sigma-70 factor (ECF subfamily)